MYAKIFSQIFDSSIADDWKTRHVFEDLLKLCDQNGVLDMTHEAISARTRVPLPLVRQCIAILERPDPRSRTPDYEGRRLVVIDPKRGWGWRIVNYAKYREMKSEFDRKSYMRNYMREYRSPDEAPAVKPCKSGSFTEVNKSLTSPSPSPSSVSGVESVREGGNGHTDAMRLQDQVNRIFGRATGERWTQNEEMLLVEVSCRPDWLPELEMIERMRDGDDPKYKIKSVRSLLENWPSHLDRARTEKTHPKSKRLEQLKRQLDRI